MCAHVDGNSALVIPLQTNKKKRREICTSQSKSFILQLQGIGKLVASLVLVKKKKCTFHSNKTRPGNILRKHTIGAQQGARATAY